MRWFCLVEVIYFNPAQTSKFYGNKTSELSQSAFKLSFLEFALGRKFLREGFAPPWDSQFFHPFQSFVR